MINTTLNSVVISPTVERMGRHYRAQHGADSLSDAQIGHVLFWTLSAEDRDELYRLAMIEIQEERHETA